MKTDAFIFWVTGSPASGKSTLAEALVQRFDRAILIPVDDIRDWVRSGRAEPVPWTNETEAQYRLGESSACGVALRYRAAGFTVVIDGCRNPVRIDELLEHEMPSDTPIKVLLAPRLEENYRRAHERTNKEFDPHYLDGIIEFTHEAYQSSAGPGWLVLDNTHLSISDEVQTILARAESRRT